MHISGKWYREGTAVQLAASLHVEGDYCVVTTSDRQFIRCHKQQIVVSDRLGNVERKLTLHDGSTFATADNNGIDQLLSHSSYIKRGVYRLESNLAWAGIAVVVTVITMFSIFRWGIPWAGEAIAHALPEKTNVLISAHALDFLDKHMFSESQLSEEKQQRINQHFRSFLLPLDKSNQDIHYQLHFRAWNHDDQPIPNAFALPSGDIIVTDQFIALAQHQDEIDAVLLHEIGHVVRRHGLERAVQAALMSTVLVLVSGDAHGLVDFGVGLGGVLVSSHYSRNHESEADQYAFEKMLRANINPEAFGRIMQRMEEFMVSSFDKAEKNNAKADDEPKEKSLFDYISSHPATDERIEQAKKYGECFKQGLTQCHF